MHYGYTSTETRNSTASSRRRRWRWRFLCDSHSLPILHHNLHHGIIYQTIYQLFNTIYQYSTAAALFFIAFFNIITFSHWSLTLSVLLCVLRFISLWSLFQSSFILNLHWFRHFLWFCNTVLFQCRFLFFSNHIRQCLVYFNVCPNFNNKYNIYNESNCWSTLCFLVCFNWLVVKYDLLAKHACLLFNNWIDASSCILLSEETYMLQNLWLYPCQTNNYFMHKIKRDLHTVRV